MMKPATRVIVTGHLADVVTTAFAGFRENRTRARTVGQLRVAVHTLRDVGSNPAGRRTTDNSVGGPMKYKGMLPDTFFEVEATDELDAQRKMLAKLRDEIQEDEFIVWKADEPAPGALS